MAWERGYYYRVRKVGGRVVREYVGKGPLAEATARLDHVKWMRRRIEALDLRDEKDEHAALEAEVKALSEQAEHAARAALLAAGYHQHKRGPWRKRREQGHTRD
jgi:hypothetical protein